MDQSVGCAQIWDRSKSKALKETQSGQKLICRDKKRHLQKQRNRALERIRRLIVILPVIGLKHHKAFIPTEGFANVLDPRAHPCFLRSLRLLHGIRSPIQRQNQEVHDQTQHDDRKSRILYKIIRPAVNHLKK